MVGPIVCIKDLNTTQLLVHIICTIRFVPREMSDAVLKSMYHAVHTSFVTHERSVSNDAVPVLSQSCLAFG